MSVKGTESNFQFNWVKEFTLGLPDYWLVDDSGHPNVDVLKRKLDIDRHNHRTMTVKLEEWLRKNPPTKITGERNYLLDALCAPNCRGQILFRAVEMLAKKQLQTVPTRGVPYPSWEAVIFHQYQPCFFSKPAGGDWKFMFDGLAWEPNGPLSESTRNKIETVNNLVFPRVLPIWTALTKDLEQWNEADPERKRLLADVAFGFLATVGPKALIHCLEIAPGIADFYQFVRAFPLNLPSKTASITDAPPAIPETLSEFYQQLQVKVERGLQSPSDLLIARDIEAFVHFHLPGLIAKPVLTESEQVELADAFIESILEIGEPLNLRDLAEEEGRAVVLAAWRRHLDIKFQSPIETGLLVEWSGSIRSHVPGIRDGLEALRVKQNEIACELQRVDEQLAAARFGRRQELEGERQHWIKESTQVVRSLSEHEARALESLLPEDISYVDLESLPTDAAFDPSEFDPSVAVALAAWAKEDAEQVDDVEEFHAEQSPMAEAAESPEIGDREEPTGAAEKDVLAQDEPQHDRCLDQDAHADENNHSNQVDPLGVDESGELDSVEMESEEGKPDTEEPDSIAPLVEGLVKIEDDSTMTPRPGALISYQADSESAARQYLEAYARRAPDLGVAIENIAFKWLTQGHLNFAFATLRAGQGMDYPIEPTMSPDLFRAAYFGLNVWSREADSLVICQRLLNSISGQVIDEWSNRRPGGKAVVYLMFAATFQPALFGAGFTSAPHLLDYVAESLPNPLRKLAKEVVTASHHNLNVSLDSLTRGTGTEDKAAGHQLGIRLSDWLDRITGKQTGWAPIRMALTDCRNRPEFQDVITAIRGENENRAAILEFVNRYTDLGAIQNLLEEQLVKVNPGGVGVAGRSAASWFTHSIVDLRILATDWLVENRVRTVGQDDFREFRERLSTLAKAALEELKSLETKAQDLDLRAGIGVATDCLRHLRSAMDGRSESVIWSAARAYGWFRIPEDLMAMDGVPNNDGAEQLKWLIERCGVDFDKRALTDAALQTGRFRIAHLMLLSRRDKGEPVDAEFAGLDKLRAKHFKSLEDRCNRIQTLIGDALIASLINEEQSYRLGAEIEHIKEEIQRRGGDPFDDLDSVEDGLTDIEAHLEVDYQAKLASIKGDYQDHLRMIHAHLGPDSVSEQWQAVMSKAIETRSLPVAEEMLDQLRNAVKEGARIGDTPRWGNPHLAAFRATEDRIYDYIKGQTDPRSFPRRLIHEHGLDLDFGNRDIALKEVAENLIEWRSSPWAKYGVSQHEQLWKVLEFIGFRQKNGTPRLGSTRKLPKGGTFVSLTVDTESVGLVRPFPVFGSLNQDGKLTVVIAFRDWRPDSLRVFLEDNQVIGPRMLLLSAVPMSPELRNVLAKSCKDHQQTLFHADLGLLIYLAAVTQDDSVDSGRRVRDFLMLAAPFTYYNPYLEGDARHPPPPEIRYGRFNEISRITTMPGGTAIIFGGRQLGKTTILHEAQRLFHNPKEWRWSWYDQMDEGMRRGGSSRAEWENARKKVWTTVYNHLVQAKAINQEPGADLDAQYEAVKAEIQQSKPGQFLLIFDEVDRILEVDAVHGFGIFRGLSGLVNQPTGRFKVVIAGLENVKRFEDSPNFPLPQLGSSLQVSIMPTLDALALIREPLEVLGYEFEDELGANRILSAVNRHPGLLQIFAHELLKRLAASHTGPVGTRKITSDDLTWVSLNPTVRDQIRNRFNMTLDLDKRYLVIVYSLILAGRASSSFTTAQAKAEAQYWLPSAFAHLTEKQFEAFLGELVGLGVIRPRHAEGREEFVLRSANILNLLGSQADIEHKLEEAIQAFEEHDPLGGHAFDKEKQIPSPLSARDEKQVLGLDDLAEPKGEKRDFARYSVALITGSKALGLHQLTDALPDLYKFDPAAPGDGSSVPYKLTKILDTEQGLTPATLRDRLRTWMKGKGAKEPGIELIEITGIQPISHTLDLLDVANKLGAEASTLRYPLRILFVLPPKALWNWVKHTDMTKPRTALQAFVALDKWCDTALAQLLDNLGLQNTTDDVAKLRAISHGWYFSLNILCDLRKKRKGSGARWLGALTSYTPIIEAKPAELQNFLKETGLEDVPWGLGLAQSLRDLDLGDNFDVVWIRTLIEEQGHGLTGDDAEAVRDWLLHLKLIEPVTGKPTGTYAFEPCIKAALGAVDGIR